MSGPLNINQGPQEAVDEINAHDHTGGLGQPIPTAGLADKVVTREKVADQAIGPEQIENDAVTGEKIPDGTITREKLADGVLSSSGTIGLKNYIADGLKFGNPDGLNLTILPGRANIEEEIQVLSIAENIALDARMTSLIYALKQTSGVPAIGKVNAVYPAAESGITVARYDMNDIFLDSADGKAKIRDSSPGGSNHLIINGTVSEVDGWVGKARQGDGSTGYMVSAGTTGFPVGNAEVELTLLVTINSLTQECIIGYGTTATNGGFKVFIRDSEFTMIDNSNIYKSGFVLEVGKTYILSLCNKDGKLNYYVNGIKVYSMSSSLQTALGNLTILRNVGYADNFSKSTIHYVELRNKCRAENQLAQLANRLIIPCRYIGYNAQYPTISDSDKATAYHEWKFDETSGSTVADSNATSPLNGVAIGTTVVDSEIGLGKARKLNGTSSDYISLGNITLPNEVTFMGVINLQSTDSQIIFCSGTADTNAFIFYIPLSGAGRLRLFIANSYIDIPVSNSVSTGLLFYAFTIKNNQVTFYINSDNPCLINQSLVFNGITNQPAYLGKSYNGYYLKGNLEYQNIIPRALSQAEIAQIYNSLMAQKEKTIADDILPSDSISLGFARTNANTVIEYDDKDYKYLRKEGSAEKNKKVFLGWKYHGGLAGAYFDFDFSCLNVPIGKVQFTVIVSPNASFENSAPIIQYYVYGTTGYGCYLYKRTNNPHIISVWAEPRSLAQIAGNTLASGYIGVWVEVIE